MALTPTEQEAVDRLAEYNGSRYVTGSNERGMGGEGYKTEIPRACNDMGAATGAVSRMAQETADAADTVAVVVSAVRLTWDTGTADADPGPGQARGNHGTVSSIATLYISTTDAAGAAISGWLDALDDPTSGTRARLRFGKIGDADVWMDFDLTGAVVAATGYRKLPVTFVAQSGAFVDGDALALGFTRNGDKGQPGATWLHGSGAPSSGLGANGDYYLDDANGNYYNKTVGSWGAPVGSLKGPSGNNKICEGGQATGTSTALVVTASPAFTGTRGEALTFRNIAAGSNGAAAQVTANGVAQALRLNGAALVGGEIPASAQVFAVSDGTYLHIAGIAMPISAGTTAGTLVLRGTDGGVTGTNFFAAGTAPTVNFYESDAGADAKRWYVQANNGKLNFGINTDDYGAAATWLEITRSGNTITGIDFKVTPTVNGAAIASAPTTPPAGYSEWWTAVAGVDTSSANVWTGRSGAILTQATAGNRPTYMLHGGVPCLDFDGVSDSLTATIASINGLSAFSFSVLLRADDATEAPLFSIPEAGSWGKTQLSMSNDGYSLFRFGTGASVTSRSGSFSAKANFFLVTATFNAGAWELYSDRTAILTTTDNGVTLQNHGTNLLIASDGSFFNGKIADVLMYNSKLTSTNIANLCSFFNARYGLAL